MYSQIHFAKVTSDFNDEQSLLTMEVDLVKPTTIISLVMNALLQPILISLKCVLVVSGDKISDLCSSLYTILPFGPFQAIVPLYVSLFCYSV